MGPIAVLCTCPCVGLLFLFSWLWEAVPLRVYFLVGKRKPFWPSFHSCHLVTPSCDLGSRGGASLAMADDQLASLPSKAAFRLLRKEDLVELAVKNELAPSPSLDRVGLRAFLKENLELEDYWQELKCYLIALSYLFALITTVPRM